MSDDQMIDDTPPDNATGLATGMIVVTTVMLIVALITVWNVLAHQYNEGPFAK